MDTFWIIFLIVFAVIIMAGIMFIMPGFIIYRVLLVRTKPEKWNRYYEGDSDDELTVIHKLGMQWGDKYDAYRTDVSIVSDGLKLVGQYFDFGGKNAVIIVPGRMEALYYSMHYTEPYRAAGLNVLVIDNRAHGNSEGKYNCVGFKEWADVLKWAEFLHDEKDNKKVVLHGICVGSATVLYAAINEKCPDYVAGIVVDGMYETFGESTANHFKERNKPLFPSLYLIMWRLKRKCGVNAAKVGPKTCINKMTKPILFLHGVKDEYSAPEKAQELYDKCPSEHKKLVWLKEGKHSRLRMHNEREYDVAVTEFVNNFAN